jgi:hypothetical protein
VKRPVLRGIAAYALFRMKNLLKGVFYVVAYRPQIKKYNADGLSFTLLE